MALYAGQENKTWVVCKFGYSSRLVDGGSWSGVQGTVATMNLHIYSSREFGIAEPALQWT